jgi:hypothetical protein
MTSQKSEEGRLAVEKKLSVQMFNDGFPYYVHVINMGVVDGHFQMCGVIVPKIE